jgi:hypothetical protein
VITQSIQEQVGTDNATLFRIIDTRSWRPINQFRYEQPFVALTADPNMTTIYAAVPRYTRATKTVLPADTIVAFEVSTGRLEAEYIRINEDIRRLVFRASYQAIGCCF